MPRSQPVIPAFAEPVSLPDPLDIPRKLGVPDRLFPLLDGPIVALVNAPAEDLLFALHVLAIQGQSARFGLLYSELNSRFIQEKIEEAPPAWADLIADSSASLTYVTARCSTPEEVVAPILEMELVQPDKQWPAERRETPFSIVKEVPASLEVQVARLLKEVVAHHSDIKELASLAVQRGIATGLLLVRIIQIVKSPEYIQAHGRVVFDDLLRNCQFSKATAYNYINMVQGIYRNAHPGADLEGDGEKGRLVLGMTLKQYVLSGEVSSERVAEFIEAFREHIIGKNITEIYRATGYLATSGGNGGAAPPKEMVRAWLALNHPELVGHKFKQLPEEIQKAYLAEHKGAYRPSSRTVSELEIEKIRGTWLVKVPKTNKGLLDTLRLEFQEGTWGHLDTYVLEEAALLLESGLRAIKDALKTRPREQPRI